MSNVNSARRVEGDWWSKPIPPNVIFGEGFYCETAQIFRHMHTDRAGRSSDRRSRFLLRRVLVRARQEWNLFDR